MNDPTYVLVHGAWHRPTCWRLLQAELGDARSVAVTLPSAGSDWSSLGGLADDVAAIQQAVHEIAGPVVVVAHSYGGIPVTEAVATLPNVTGIIYVAAFVPDVGESLAVLAGQHGQPSWLDPHPEQGYADVDNPAQVFYSDVDSQTAAEYTAEVVHQSLSSTITPTTAAAWRDVASAYVLCELDAVIPPEGQEFMAARTRHVHRLQSGHSPFVSQPEKLAAIIRNTPILQP